MSAYKKLNQQDAFITTYTARKSWTASGSQYSNLCIQNIVGLSGSIPYFNRTSDLTYGGVRVPAPPPQRYNRRLVYKSIHHLYYSLFKDGVIDPTGSLTGSFENYLQSSFNVSGSRYLNERVAIFSLPKEIYGTHIEPKSISIKPDLLAGTGSNYIDNNYVTDILTDPTGTSYLQEDNLYIENTSGLYGSTSSSLGEIIDDGEGNLYLTYNRRELDYIENESDYVDETDPSPGEYTDEPTYNRPRRHVGNVIYPHGQIIITDPEIAMYYNHYHNAILSWKSNLPIYTHNYHCRVKTSEFNHTFNKTALNLTNGLKADNITGSSFQPYFTTIGLYNEANELIAVGKMGQPVPKSADTDMTVVVKLDMNFGVNRCGDVITSAPVPADPEIDPQNPIQTFLASMEFVGSSMRAVGAYTWTNPQDPLEVVEISRRTDTLYGHQCARGTYKLVANRHVSGGVDLGRIYVGNTAFNPVAGNRWADSYITQGLNKISLTGDIITQELQYPDYPIQSARAQYASNTELGLDSLGNYSTLPYSSSQERWGLDPYNSLQRYITKDVEEASLVPAYFGYERITYINVPTSASISIAENFTDPVSGSYVTFTLVPDTYFYGTNTIDIHGNRIWLQAFKRRDTSDPASQTQEIYSAALNTTSNPTSWPTITFDTTTGEYVPDYVP